MSSDPRILLVGSIPLRDAEAVFRTLASSVGPLAQRYPDGETGVRTNWIRWQRHIFEGNPSFEPHKTVNQAGIKDDLQRPFYNLRSDADASTITFEPLGFAREAIRSFRTFSELKRDGVVPRTTRFQVSLPTVVAILSGFVVVGDRGRAEPALQAAMAREIEQIAAAIPHNELAIQWDVCLELVGYDGGYELHYPDMLEGTVGRVARLVAMVPDDVEVGIHLCYGDPGHKHLIEPRDTRSCIKLANAISAAVSRDLGWIHIPIPRGWTEPHYYQPLEDLSLPSKTELYLGLVHFTDGEEGTRRRASIARQFVKHFGFATECGFGRRPEASVAPLLALHRSAAQASA